MTGRRVVRAARWSVIVAVVVLGAALILARAGVARADPPSATATGSYVVLAWNDLGMHCYNESFANLAVLPPYNTLYAQVIRTGSTPAIVTRGVTVEYSFPADAAHGYGGNTYSVGKTDFWDYDQALFGVDLPANVGLTGNGLSGTMDRVGDHFVVTGIPLTEFMDTNLVNRYPYQLALVVVRDASTGVELARTTPVAPLSSEMSCDNCHADGGDATTAYPITPTGSVDQNILALHDFLNQGAYPAGHTTPLMDRRPVLCAECHSSNALGAAGVAGVSSLSNAMHKRHQSLPDITPDTAGCYNCHPGPQTQCLRDVMSQDEGMTCVACHGTVSQVAQNPSPWLSEPRCDNDQCHADTVALNQPLYRMSVGHGGVYCAGCHDSPHAIALSREANDAIKFVDLQGHSGTLNRCTVCHDSEPAAEFTHQGAWWRVFLPKS